jgi:hypothetical protein
MRGMPERRRDSDCRIIGEKVNGVELVVRM